MFVNVEFTRCGESLFLVRWKADFTLHAGAVYRISNAPERKLCKVNLSAREAIWERVALNQAIEQVLCCFFAGGNLRSGAVEAVLEERAAFWGEEDISERSAVRFKFNLLPRFGVPAGCWKSAMLQQKFNPYRKQQALRGERRLFRIGATAASSPDWRADCVFFNYAQPACLYKVNL